MIISQECRCSECRDRDDPCQMDCDAENECMGCRDRRDEVEEIQFEIDVATGRK